MMSLANLCNRLVVTSTQWNPNSQLQGFRLSIHQKQLNELFSAVPHSRFRHLGLWVIAQETLC
jgi:hypothetical protein